MKVLGTTILLSIAILLTACGSSNNNNNTNVNGNWTATLLDQSNTPGIRIHHDAYYQQRQQRYGNQYHIYDEQRLFRQWSHSDWRVLRNRQLQWQCEWRFLTEYSEPSDWRHRQQYA